VAPPLQRAKFVRVLLRRQGEVFLRRFRPVAAPVDDAAETRCHHVEEASDAGKQEDRRQRELNGACAVR
jgi:hypothetical protein